jgi:hypothetical protein
MVEEKEKSGPVEHRPEQAGPAPQKKSMAWIIPVVIVVIIVIAVVLAVFVLRPSDGSGGGPSILSVSHTPLNPAPGENTTVTITVDDGYLRDIHVMPYFEGMHMSEPGFFDEVEDGVYESNFRPFNDGTEIWYIVNVHDRKGTYVFSYDNTIQVGHVERSAISTLSISNVEYSTANPNFISVQADITSDATITHVYLVNWVEYIDEDGMMSGSGGMPAMSANGDTYSSMMSPLSGITTSSVVVEAHGFFRIVAQDDSGNTAVSEPMHIESTP